MGPRKWAVPDNIAVSMRGIMSAVGGQDQSEKRDGGICPEADGEVQVARKRGVWGNK